MKIGVHPAALFDVFFHGEPWTAMIPGEAEKSLWNAAGSGAAVWRLLEQGEPWNSWSSAVIVDDISHSQYDGLIVRLREGCRLPSPAACIALQGNRFHGQRNRPWEALRGNLHLTVHFAVDRPVSDVGHGFTLLPAVAVIGAINRLSGGAIDVGIKWVNDLVVGFRKVGGFIASTLIEGDKVQNVVIGLGINVAVAPSVAPTPFVPATACLREFDSSLHVGALLGPLLGELNRWYDILLREGWRPLLEAYRQYAVVVGRSVRIWQEGEETSAGTLGTIPPLARGIVAAINEDLSLRIDGHPESVMRGRLAFDEALACLTIDQG